MDDKKDPKAVQQEANREMAEKVNHVLKHLSRKNEDMLAFGKYLGVRSGRKLRYVLLESQAPGGDDGVEIPIFPEDYLLLSKIFLALHDAHKKEVAKSEVIEEGEPLQE